MEKNILIVDDSSSMRQLVSFALEDAAYTVIAAVHGRDALEKLNSSPVGMVITDLNMPEMDGLELIRCLRSIPEHRFTPVVVLTTEARDERLQESAEASASDWIVKPFTPEQLIEVVKRFAN